MTKQRITKKSLANTDLNKNGNIPIAEAISIEDAQAVVIKEAIERQKQCEIGLQKLLEKEKCVMVSVLITPSGVIVPLKDILPGWQAQAQFKAYSD